MCNKVPPLPNSVRHAFVDISENVFDGYAGKNSRSKGSGLPDDPVTLPIQYGTRSLVTSRV